MRGDLLVVALIIVAVSSGAASAAPLSPLPPKIALPPEALSGHLDMYMKDQAIVVDLRASTDGAVDRQFRVEVSESAGLLPSSFHSDAARIAFWTGHLVVIADRERQIYHFSVAGFDPPNLSRDRHELPARAQEAGSLVASGYKMTRITGALGLISNTPAEARSLNVPPGAVPGASFLTDCCATGDDSCCLDYQDYNSGGGGSSCAGWCTISCRDNSTCSVTCSSPSCAHCSCPASCSCS
jgi:hypothetical protein